MDVSQGLERERQCRILTSFKGRRYLDYDLDALVAFLKNQESKRVIIAFQDSEAFDNSLLSDLIVMLKSVFALGTWRILSLANVCCLDLGKDVSTSLSCLALRLLSISSRRVC